MPQCMQKAGAARISWLPGPSGGARKADLRLPDRREACQVRRSQTLSPCPSAHASGNVAAAHSRLCRSPTGGWRPENTGSMARLIADAVSQESKSVHDDSYVLLLFVSVLQAADTGGPVNGLGHEHFKGVLAAGRGVLDQHPGQPGSGLGTRRHRGGRLLQPADRPQMGAQRRVERMEQTRGLVLRPAGACPPARAAWLTWARQRCGWKAWRAESLFEIAVLLRWQPRKYVSSDVERPSGRWFVPR